MVAYRSCARKALTFAWLVLVVFAPPSAVAGFVDIIDTAETITASSDIGARFFGFTCVLEVCTFAILAPSPEVNSASSTIFNSLSEPGTTQISDRLAFNNGLAMPSFGVGYTFSSDSGVPGGSGPCGTPFVPPCIPEDGTLQTLATVTFFVNGVAVVTDTIRVQSDITEGVVPEPSTIPLVLLGFAVFFAINLRRGVIHVLG